MRGGPIGARLPRLRVDAAEPPSARLVADGVAVALGVAPHRALDEEATAAVGARFVAALAAAEPFAVEGEGNEGLKQVGDLFAKLAADAELPGRQAGARLRRHGRRRAGQLAATERAPPRQAALPDLAAFLLAEGAEEERGRLLLGFCSSVKTKVPARAKLEVVKKDLAAAIRSDAELQALLRFRQRGQASRHDRAALCDAAAAIPAALEQEADGSIGLADFLALARAHSQPPPRPRRRAASCSTACPPTRPLAALVANGVAPQRVVQVVDASGGEARAALAALLEATASLEAATGDGATLSAESLAAALAAHAEKAAGSSRRSTRRSSPGSPSYRRSSSRRRVAASPTSARPPSRRPTPSGSSPRRWTSRPTSRRSRATAPARSAPRAPTARSACRRRAGWCRASPSWPPRTTSAST